MAGDDLLATMATHLGWELDWGSRDPNDEEGEHGWRVHDRRGNRSDLEWTLIGFGASPADALRAALPEPAMSTELVERLREAVAPDGHEARMKGWDYARKLVIAGDRSSHPRDIIESEFAELEEYVSEAADELTALTAKVAEAEQRIAALMSERSSLIATKAEQLVALTKRVTAAEWERDELAKKAMTVGAMWQDEFDARHALTAKVALLTEALRQARIWHESEDKSLSKQQPSHGPTGNQWARLQHQEQMAEIDAALSEPDKNET